MKKHLILTLTLILSSFIYAQQVNNTVGGSNLSNTFQVSQFVTGQINGTPYLLDEWKQGLILINGKVDSQYYIKYNILEERMEFSDNVLGDGARALAKEQMLIVQLDGRSFQFIDFSEQVANLAGYFEIIKSFDAKNLLLKRVEKGLNQPNEIQRSGYATSDNQKPSITTKTAFYYVADGEIKEIQNHKKRSLKALNNTRESDLKAFIKEKDIDFDDDGNGLAELISYYRSIK
jgi:hypothetical protein